MSFNGLMFHSATISRQLAGTGIQLVWTPVITDLACFIQPQTAEYAAKTGNVYGRSYNAFFPAGSNVQISDKVVDQDGKQYRVTGSLNRNYGSIPYLLFTLTQESGATPDQ